MSNNIRIAVSLSGMPRNFDKCCKNTLKFFDVDNAEIDFFIHAWNNDCVTSVAYDTKNSRESLETSKTLNSEVLKKSLIRAYNPKSIVVEDQRESEDIEIAADIITQSLLYSRRKTDIPDWINTIVDPSGDYIYDSFLSYPLHLAQTYSISKSAELVHQYSMSHQKEYDLVFRFRFDNFVEIPPKKLRTKLFHNMVSLMEWADKEAKKETLFRRNYLFPAWITVVGDSGLVRNTTWIGDKMFSCSARTYRIFEKYFDFQIARILSYDTGKKEVNKHEPFFMPEQTMYEICLKNKLFAHSKAYLNNIGLVSYRDYHLPLEDQSFESLQEKYREHDNMNGDSSEGIVLGL